jgi:hypothetical protein
MQDLWMSWVNKEKEEKEEVAVNKAQGRAEFIEKCLKTAQALGGKKPSALGMKEEGGRQKEGVAEGRSLLLLVDREGEGIQGRLFQRWR